MPESATHSRTNGKSAREILNRSRIAGISNNAKTFSALKLLSFKRNKVK